MIFLMAAISHTLHPSAEPASNEMSAARTLYTLNAPFSSPPPRCSQLPGCSRYPPTPTLHVVGCLAVVRGAVRGERPHKGSPIGQYAHRQEQP